MSPAKNPPGLWTGQALHVFSLAILLGLVWAAWKFIGRPSPVAFWTAVAFPIAHQVFVWLTWRLELRSAATSRVLGFRLYLACFFALFFGRFVSIAVLAWLDRDTLGLPVLAQAILTALLVIPGSYAGYSVQRYFGMVRAAGADHFDPRYRAMPLVSQGIFRWTKNGMYVYAFLLFWAIATGFDSAAALAVAAFSHAYIWAHYLATEKPDMEFLYAGEGWGGRVTDLS